ncbi:MAG TPA: hypothetical protein VGP72_00400 [Planctomycetota bacterium]|jgi:hypothetical protein
MASKLIQTLKASMGHYAEYVTRYGEEVQVCLGCRDRHPVVAWTSDRKDRALAAFQRDLTTFNCNRVMMIVPLIGERDEICAHSISDCSRVHYRLFFCCHGRFEPMRITASDRRHMEQFVTPLSLNAGPGDWHIRVPVSGCAGEVVVAAALPNHDWCRYEWLRDSEGRVFRHATTVEEDWGAPERIWLNAEMEARRAITLRLETRRFEVAVNDYPLAGKPRSAG